MATTFEQRILPEIWLMPAWNTFVHGMSLSNIRNLHHWDLPSDANDIPDVLAAENLAATCKALRRLIMGTELLFYKLNTFHFYGAWTMSAYMTAITPSKRNAIRSIRLIVDGPPKNLAPAFTILSTCEGLEHLTLDLTYAAEMFRWPPNFFRLPGMYRLMSLRGLKSFKITYGNQPSWNFLQYVHNVVRHVFMNPQSEIDLMIEVAVVEKMISDIITKGTKAQCAITQDQVQKVVRKINMDPRVDELDLSLPISDISGVQQDVNDTASSTQIVHSTKNVPLGTVGVEGKNFEFNSVTTINEFDTSVR